MIVLVFLRLPLFYLLGKADRSKIAESDIKKKNHCKGN